MIKRILAAVFLAPPFLWLLWQGGIYSALLFAAIAAAAAWEFADMTEQGKGNCPKWFLMVWSVTLVLSCWKWGAEYLGVVITIPLLGLLLSPLKSGNFRGESDRLAHSLFGAVYCGLMVSFMMLLRTDFAQGNYIIIMLIIMIWVQDTGAYFFGTAYGKHKLTKLSPKKSWEGSVAGLCAAVAAGWLFVENTSLTFPVAGWAIFPGFFLVALAGQLGDLFESLLKRDFGVKDSGSIIPGHGGVLDRFDSLLMASPVLYFFCKIMAMPKG